MRGVFPLRNGESFDRVVVAKREGWDMVEPGGITRLPRRDGRRRPLSETKPPRKWRSKQVQKPPSPPAEPVFAAEPISRVESVPRADPIPEAVPQTPPEPERLQERYGYDRIVLLVRDPRWVFAWWEVTDPTLEAARSELGAQGTLVLRVYPLEGAQGDPYDVPVHDTIGDWYLELGQPGGRFEVEIGLRTPGGSFRPLVRSNPVTLPHDRVSSVTDEAWMVSEEASRRLFGLSRLGLGSDEMIRLRPRRGDQ